MRARHRVKPIHIALIVASAVFLTAGTVRAAESNEAHGVDQRREALDASMVAKTMVRSTFLGVIAGAMVGGAVYALRFPHTDTAQIRYWAAGGAVVGAGAGAIELAIRDSRISRSLVERNSDAAPAPRFVLPLLHWPF